MPVHNTTPRAEPDPAEAVSFSPANPGQVTAARSARDTGRRQPAGLGHIRGVLVRVPPRWRAPLAAYLGCQAIFLFWWIAFYPGLMSYDSIIYVLHVTTGPWVNDHSVLYYTMVWLSLHTTGGLAALTLVQTIATSAVFAYTVAAFRRLGVRGRWTAIAAMTATALPPTGAFIIFIWDDVPFTICALLTVPTVAHLVSLQAKPGRPRDRRTNLLVAALGLELLGMDLFRLNGFVIAIIGAAALVVLLPGLRAKLAAVAAAGVCMAFLLNYVVYPAAGIEKTPIFISFAAAYSDIAVAYAESPSSFTPADKRLMVRVAPLAAWAGTADCYDSDFTTRIPGFIERSTPLSHQLLGLWLRVLKRSPNLLLGARICRGSIAWRVFPGPVKYTGNTVEPGDQVPANLFLLAPDLRGNPYRSALRADPPSSELNKVANFLWNASKTSQLEWLLWRGAFWCYLSYLALFAFARNRQNWQLLSLGAIVIALQVGVMVEIPAQLYRYMVGPIFIGIILIPLFFARNRPAPVTESGTAPGS